MGGGSCPTPRRTVKRGTAPGGLPLTVIVVVVCAAAVILGLLLGVPALVAALQNPYG